MRILKITGALCVLLSMGAGPVCGQGLTRLGGFEHGAMFGLAVDGTTAYVGNGYYLQKVDLSDPAVPVLVEELRLDGAPAVIELAGGYAYVGLYPHGLQVVDVSGPGPMGAVGSFDPEGIERNLALSGTNVFVVGDPGLVVLDVSDPTDPDSVGALGLNHPFDIEIAGTTAYVFDEDGLHVVDVTDPTAPVVLSTLAYLPIGGLDVGALRIDGNRLYIVYTEGLRALDITDPENPVPRGKINTGFVGFGIGAANDLVYLTSWSKLDVFSFANPDIPTWIGGYDFGRKAHHAGAVVADGTTTYFADTYHGLSVLNVSDPYAITETGLFPVPGYFQQVARNGDLVVTAGIPDIRLFDMSDPASPNPLATLPRETADGDVQDILLDGDYLYAVWDRVLRVYDISNPAAPSEIYEYESPYFLEFLATISGEPRLVISAEQRYLYLDMSVPSSPSVAVQPPMAYWPDEIAVHNGYILAFNWIRMWVTDIDTPDQPCGAIFLPEPFSELDGIALDEGNNILFLGLKLGHVLALDVADPCNILELDRTGVPAEIEGLAVRRGSQGEPGVLVLNKVDDEIGSVTLFGSASRTDFEELGRYDGIFMAEDMVAEGDEVIVTAGIFGFHVLQSDAFTPVALAFFGAARHGDEVVVSWELGQDDSRSGFFVYREERAGERIRLNDSPLRGGRRFEFVDPAAPSGAVTYWLEEIDAAGGRHWLRSIAVGPAGEFARRPVLHPNTPNPFAPRTRIEFDLPVAGPVHLAVYDPSGRLVAVLLDGPQPAGRGQVEWDGRDAAGRPAASGVYFTVLRAGGEVQRRKAVLAR